MTDTTQSHEADRWAFAAITGYRGPSRHASAAVDGWQALTDEDLAEEINAQVEHFAPDDIEGCLHTSRVVRAIRRFADTTDADRAYRASLVDEDDD